VGMPEQKIIIETAKESWTIWKYVLGILGTISAGIVIEFFRRKVWK